MGSTANEDLNVDFLIVGAGPAGASLAAFMAQNETLRDIGLEEDAIGHATHGDMFQSFRWARSMVGEEYGKVQAWGSHPRSMVRNKKPPNDHQPPKLTQRIKQIG
ncbi:hypothetical protein ONZ43_g5418 [Nemania bipapillata]|uniref:Uncharacterized protein n=1 Tax=Nemania bipapillata TaxID=110536 RepID=A0ACC2IAZ5_9PEZI|nr:hypothetical protein ONZ43_g5418 [Nemania bipapillata]